MSLDIYRRIKQIKENKTEWEHPEDYHDNLENETTSTYDRSSKISGSRDSCND